ncbi:MAG TPA: VapC toxin family PIN domain ribonuclease [Candidatus Aminicenantes bacterium]|nr:VapC toxin family PIN domain ribonuclease [Candidatus Aminicenantes bacterium]
MTGEDGADQVEKILLGKENRPFIPWAVLFEVYYITKQTRGEKEADRRFVLIKELPASILWQMEEPEVLTAARIKAQFRISFADSIIAATAFRLDAILVHKDPEYECLSGTVKLHSLLS